MPQYVVTGPDGKQYRVTAPEGATEAQVMSRVRQQAVPAESKPDEYQYEGDESAFEKFLIGAGRGLHDIGQGAKQKALMALESMGLGEEGSAQEYSEKVAEEVERFEKDFPGLGAESVGRFAGWAAPGALAPGLGIAGTAALGGAEAALMPTEDADWKQVAANAALGAATGGAIRGAPGAVKGIKNLPPITGRKLQEMTPEARSGLEYAADKGLKLRPGNIIDSPTNRAGTNIANRGVLNKGSEKTLKEARGQLEELQGRYKPADLQEEYIRGVQKGRDTEKAVWDQAESVMGDTRVSADGIVNQMAEELGRMKATGGNAAQAAKLEKLFDDLPAGVLEEGTTSWSNLKEFRSNFAAANAPKFGEIGMTPAIAKRMYGAISREMEKGAKRHGKPGVALYEKAKNATKNRRSLEKQAGVQKAVARGEVQRPQLIEKIAMGSDRDRSAALNQILTTEGREGVKNLIANQIAESGLSGQRIVGPGSAERTTRKLMDQIDTFMSPDEAAEMRGLMNYMKSVKSEAGEVANLPTGQRLMDMGTLAQAGVSVANPTAGVPMLAVTQAVLPALFRRRDASAILKKLSTAEGGSKLHKGLIRELNRIMTELAAGGAGAQATQTPTIEIRNGRTP
jgi:hypothetical protein